jgi:hypothetical protein
MAWGEPACSACMNMAVNTGSDSSKRSAYLAARRPLRRAPQFHQRYRTAMSTESGRLLNNAMLALRDELARGIGSAPKDRIRAATALGAVHAAVLGRNEFGPAIVRDVVTDAAVAILLS